MGKVYANVGNNIKYISPLCLNVRSQTPCGQTTVCLADMWPKLGSTNDPLIDQKISFPPL